MHTDLQSSETKFVRRTMLKAGESRCNFRQIDREAIRTVSSREARRVTNLMAHVYLCLIDAPYKFHESEGVLRFGGEMRDGKQFTAWDQLIELLGVADGTAHKALEWMREQEVIGYFAGRNGAGIRIFLNRAASSIKRETGSDQKNLPASPVAVDETRVSQNAMSFKKSPRRFEDTKINTFAPKNSAEADLPIENSFNPKLPDTRANNTARSDREITANVITQLKNMLAPELRTIAAQAAAHEAARESERTRQWLDKHGLPKAARVAQREAYNVFKHESAKTDAAERARVDSQVGRGAITTLPPAAKTCTTLEISEIAEACVTMFELQGKPIDATLAEISTASGGWVAAADVPRIREAAHDIMRKKDAGKRGELTDAQTTGC